MKSALLDLNLYDEPMDRRQKKTMFAVEQSLIELLEEKPIEMITISELAQRADINRKTFYNNYSSIDDVIKKFNARIANTLYKSLPNTVTLNNEIEIYNLMLSYATILEPYKKLLSGIIQQQSNFTLLAQLSTILLPYIEHNLTIYNVNKKIVPYVNIYIINGMTSLFYQWCKDDNLDAKQLALLAYNLTSSAMKLDNYKDILPQGKNN